MNPWEDAKEILELVKDEKNWNAELFDRCKNNNLVSPCIHNQIRKILSPEQYRRFDDAYCFHYRPNQRKIVEFIRREKQREGEEEKWKQEQEKLLNKKRQLLKQRLQKLTGN